MTTVLLDHNRILALEAEVRKLRDDVMDLASLGKTVNSLVDANSRQIESHAKFIKGILLALPKECWR